MTNRRRLFLVAAGAACYAAMTPEAYAQLRAVARRTDKPLFTTEALNRMIPAPGAANYQAWMAEASADPRGFVRAHFTLSAEQDADLTAIPDADIAALQAFMRQTAANNLPFAAAPAPAQSGGGAQSDQNGCQKFGNWLTGSDSGVGDTGDHMQSGSAEMREVTLHVNIAARDAILQRGAQRAGH